MLSQTPSSALHEHKLGRNMQCLLNFPGFFLSLGRLISLRVTPNGIILVHSLTSSQKSIRELSFSVKLIFRHALYFNYSTFLYNIKQRLTRSINFSFQFTVRRKELEETDINDRGSSFAFETYAGKGERK